MKPLIAYYGGYTQEDFNELCELLDSIQGSFVLSCYKNPAVKPHWEEFTFSSVCSAANGRNTHRDERTEYVWRMDRSRDRAIQGKFIFGSKEKCET